VNPDPATLLLRDYHLPPPPSWWPPAPGWWLVTLLLLLAGGLSWWWYRRQRRLAPLRAARRELASLRRAAAKGADPSQVVARLSMLLRRVALLCHPQERIACLSGSAWLWFLDRAMEDEPFSHGSGRALIEAPYRQGVEIDLEPLFELAELWLVNEFRSDTDRINLIYHPRKMARPEPSPPGHESC